MDGLVVEGGIIDRSIAAIDALLGAELRVAPIYPGRVGSVAGGEPPSNRIFRGQGYVSQSVRGMRRMGDGDGGRQGGHPFSGLAAGKDLPTEPTSLRDLHCDLLVPFLRSFTSYFYHSFSQQQQEQQEQQEEEGARLPRRDVPALHLSCRRRRQPSMIRRSRSSLFHPGPQIYTQRLDLFIINS
eukprot:GHVU01170457.1.p1 GENE.GHVU01170457.1~~GHVU01170457.1.p1  ORF type:complete len:184 (+),score=21.02 GHVU01170457.1:253-804(+)